MPAWEAPHKAEEHALRVKRLREGIAAADEQAAYNDRKALLFERLLDQSWANLNRFNLPELQRDRLDSAKDAISLYNNHRPDGVQDVPESERRAFRDIADRHLMNAVKIRKYAASLRAILARVDIEGAPVPEPTVTDTAEQDAATTAERERILGELQRINASLVDHRIYRDALFHLRENPPMLAKGISGGMPALVSALGGMDQTYLDYVIKSASNNITGYERRRDSLEAQLADL